ncbi:signal peptidase II [Thalassobaculum sp.]|uniref:signal peptidase II n=1 Tax=Thalassobaculum sp. TaxID=2022740 RepID=UPI003B5AC2D5
MRSALTRGLGLGALVVIADQATKLWALSALFDPPRRVPILPVLDFVPVWNRGVSFGLLANDSPWGPWLLSGFALVVCLFMGFWLARSTSWPLIYGLGAVIGGAVGNVIDRMLYGAVFDFIDVHYGGWHWPAFNIADSAITLGVALLLLDAFGIGIGTRKGETEGGHGNDG